MGKTRALKIISFHIDDDLSLQNQNAIEVTLILNNGEKRWCYFTNMEALRQYGDFIHGTDIRVHYGSPHGIIVAGKLDEPIVGKVLKQIESDNEIIKCSLPVKTYS